MARDLVCLLKMQSRQQDVAELTKLIEKFFISGAARIDLIAKVVDLDNDMRGLNFDIPLLEEMENALTSLSEPTGIGGFTRVYKGRFPFDQKFLIAFLEISSGEWNSIFRNFRNRGQPREVTSS